MAKAITVKVTDKTDFEAHTALKLGDILVFNEDGVYKYPNGTNGTYNDPWLEKMLSNGSFAEVLSERKFRDTEAPEWATAVGCFQGGWYWEEDINQRNGARFQNITGTKAYEYDNHTVKGWDQYKVLPAFVEEQLPPAPTAVMYLNDTPTAHRELKLQGAKGYPGHLVLNVGDGKGNSKSIVLSPESALQLAHDLNRMGMAGKRKLKEQANG
ncbi:gp11 [Shigella phage Buco]|uniref:Putative membrane protein n=1 Tax=Shigella phage Buco TaxID=2530183 RepID=A0A482JGP0_9CAUD|nr:gp11 [Shigella phage Buco]QBP32911.1 putative membrane protein [Shigella phage Buco]